MGADCFIRPSCNYEKAAEKITCFDLWVIDSQGRKAGMEKGCERRQSYLGPKVVADKVRHSGQRIKVLRQ
jgi:hypothetical protein